MADPQDLTTPQALTATLAAGGYALTAAQVAALPSLVTSASKLICRECRRFFALTTFDEVLTPYPGQPDKGEPDFLLTTGFPLQTVTRVSAGRTTALTLANADGATNQEAYAQFTVTGDPEISLTRTGLTLVREASGVATANVFPWTLGSPYTTIASLAASVNGTGGGWLATAAAGTGPRKAADLWGPVSALDALAPPGLSLDVFAARLRADTDPATGTVYLPPTSGGPGSAYLWPDSPAPRVGFREPVRVTYTAGWPTVPEPVQEACAELVKATLDRVAADGSLQSETAKDYSYTVRAAWDALPPWVRQKLAPYRAAR